MPRLRNRVSGGEREGYVTPSGIYDRRRNFPSGADRRPISMSAAGVPSPVHGAGGGSMKKPPSTESGFPM
ncbi:MAG: hypothetical protein FWD90_09090 [Defluviitaleaceae bacterium]|nr:hypothetical protein [Defluviitaleaceae bacterium]